MSRETLKEFLANVKGSSADSISFGNLSDKNASDDVDRGDDLGIDPNTGEQLIQLSEDDRGLLGDYVNYIATHYRGGNTYSISPGNKASADINRGSNIQNAETTSNSAVFASQSTTLGNTLGSYSNSGKFESSESGLDTIIDKTSTDKELDGHTLLSGDGDQINKAGSPNPGNDDNDHRFLKQMTTEMLQRNNRFSPGGIGKQYSESRTESNDVIDDKDIAKAQNSFGSYDTDGDSFIQKNLKSLGASVLLKAAGLDVDTMNPEDFNEANIADTISTSVVSRDLEAANAYNSPVNRDSRGAFDSSSGQRATTVHNVPGIEFEGDNTVLNEKILVRFNELLSDTLAEDEEFERKNESVYTTNSYFDSVERFLNTTIRDTENLDNKDKAYFVSIAKSVIRSNDLAQRDASKVSQYYEKIRKILDVFAALGDTDLLLYKPDGKKQERMWDVDKLKDGPATRISKSRSKNGFNEKSLAWRTASMPSMYHMPMSILRSVQRTGTVSKKNPIKGMLGSSIGDKTYLAQNWEEGLSGEPLKAIGAAAQRMAKSDDIMEKSDTSRTRIPKAMVDAYENKLDAEYVPFYFHDLRTNEIVAFHAFLTSLSESFSANHTAHEGYGRMDDVLIYKNTKRTISGKFILTATSKEDFDEMWFKVNKLVEMLYPQWSSGDLLTAKDEEAKISTSFVRPFSQIPAVSPMIRLRVGDVIKGNYSRFNLGRLFGSGHVDTYINANSVTSTTLGSLAAKMMSKIWGEGDEINSGVNLLNEVAVQVFMVAFGTPLQFLDMIPDDEPIGAAIKSLAYQALSNVLENGFVNPIVFVGLNKLKDPDISDDYGPDKDMPVLIKPTPGKLLHPIEGSSSKPLTIDRILKAKISKIFPKNGKTHYNVTIIDAASKLNGELFEVTFEDIIVDPDFMFEKYFAWYLDPLNNVIDKAQDAINNAAAEAGISGDAVDLFTTTFEDFMSPTNNSITKSFEESAGRGLAGFIGKLSYDLIGKANWETDHGSRAPMMLEISFDFKPIHDIGPGLDSHGFSRAPIYNVGSIMNNIAGDQQGEGLSSKYKFNKAASSAIKKQK